MKVFLVIAVMDGMKVGLKAQYNLILNWNRKSKWSLQTLIFSLSPLIPSVSYSFLAKLIIVEKGPKKKDEEVRKSGETNFLFPTNKDDFQRQDSGWSSGYNVNSVQNNSIKNLINKELIERKNTSGIDDPSQFIIKRIEIPFKSKKHKFTIFQKTKSNIINF